MVASDDDNVDDRQVSHVRPTKLQLATNTIPKTHHALFIHACISFTAMAHDWGFGAGALSRRCPELRQDSLPICSRKARFAALERRLIRRGIDARHVGLQPTEPTTHLWQQFSSAVKCRVQVRDRRWCVNAAENVRAKV